MNRRAIFVAVVCAALVTLALGAASASALQRVNTHNFGLDGQEPGEMFGNEVTVAAFDQTNNRFYSRMVVFGLHGWSVPTPGTYVPLGPPWPIDESEGPAASTSGIAVDNTGLSTNGNFYGAQRNSREITGYGASGAALPGFPIISAEPTPFSTQLCGAVVDSAGTILVGNESAKGVAEGRGILRFSPAGTELPPLDTSGIPGTPCGVAVDAADNLYLTTSEENAGFPPVGTTGRVWKLTKASGYADATLFSSDPATAIAVNRSTGHVFVARRERVTEFDSSGNIVQEFGNEPGTSSTKRFLGVTVDESTDEVYAADSNENQSENKIRVYSAPQAVKPEAVTNPATGVVRNGAVLHGQVDPAGGGEITECVFQLGTTTGYGESVPCVPGTPLAGPTAVEATLTSAEVTPGTLYHFRVLATSADGTHVGIDRTFTSQPAVFDTTTEAPTEVTESSATFNGSFDPDGFQTNYFFEYGESTEYGSKAPLPVPPGGDGGNGSGTVDVSVPVAGLETNTTPEGREYNFRLVAENSFGTTYGENQVFHTLPHVKQLTTLPPTDVKHDSFTMEGTFDPNGEATQYYFEWGRTISYGSYAPVDPPGVDGGEGSGPHPVEFRLTALEPGVSFHYRLVASNVHGSTIGPDVEVITNEQPTIELDRATEINTDTARLQALINPNALETTYHWEYGTEDCSVATCEQTQESSVGSGTAAVPVSFTIEGLTPGATYHFRLVAQNARGTTTRVDREFTTFEREIGEGICDNVLERKQTGAGVVPQCRAYELVSAANSGGYDVESNLIQGLQPKPGFPHASDKVLYSVRFGSIPGSGNPPNRGGDPYLATRTATGWQTQYVGLQANGTPSVLPFSSTLAEADQSLNSFAFGGPQFCDPCFPDGSQNMPLRLPDGSLVKGMAGSLNPAADPSGEIAKRFSGDGNHFVFGSTQRFESAGNEGALSIYDRNLTSDTTQVVSTMPDGSTMPGAGTSQLDISNDGSRILIGRENGTDAAGNSLYDLYMHIGTDPNSVPVVAGGVLYAGMTADGSKVFFRTADTLDDDADGGADLFRADVTSTGADVTRVSTGSGGAGNVDACNPVANSQGNHWNEPGLASAATCGVVTIAGGGGIASGDGTAYFLSPELLDGAGNGTVDEPNLYTAEPGSAPTYLATLEVENVAVLHGVEHANERDSADFQTTSDGSYAVFNSDISLTGEETAGHDEIYRSVEGGGLECVSCPLTNGAPSTDTRLTSGGLNLIDDGRVAFTSSEQLVLRDTNQLKDAYEWDEGTAGLISTGLDLNDSALLTVSADGKDVFFFTRQSLAPQDKNGGAMKIYDAREDGGFLYNSPPRPCVASDECHGPGSEASAPPPVNTIEGTEEPQPPIEEAPTGKKPKKCRKGFVKRHGKCVKKAKKHRKKHQKKHQKSHGGGRSHG